MHSLMAILMGVDGERRALAGGRPEEVRRGVISICARIVLAVGAVSLPAALYVLTHAVLLPFVLAMIGLSAGALSLSMALRGQFERSAATQIYATILTGLLLTVADPQIADFGLAIALLAPVMASLLTRTPVKKRAWAMLVVVAAAAGLQSLQFIAWPEPWRDEFSLMSGLAFAVTGSLVAYAAHQLNQVFEVYEKAQVNAFRHLIEHVQDAVMRFGADGSVLFSSKSSEKLFGCRRFELGGAGLIERIHVLDRPAYMTAFAEANRDGMSRRVEIRMRRDEPDMPAAAPNYLWIEAALSPVIDPDAVGVRHEVVVLFRDVTERKDQENEMRRAYKLAEEASTAKSRFLATIGHELRTPLNAIVGFSEMMTSGVVGELSPKHREYAQLIHQSGSHLIEVVKMLLDMSRLEAGKFELQTESFNPDGLIAPCFRIVDGMAREKRVRLMTDIPRALPQMVADERACRQVLINLLSNAIKFSHERSVVTVGMRRQGRHLALSVTDQGIGMDGTAVSRVGEPFFQANEGLARRYEGTGLGLSIVKGLVELHGGTLHVASTPGQGTTMTVLLPINGPETKGVETEVLTPLHREAVLEPMPQWQDDERRKAL